MGNDAGRDDKDIGVALDDNGNDKAAGGGKFTIPGITADRKIEQTTGGVWDFKLCQYLQWHKHEGGENVPRWTKFTSFTPPAISCQ